MDFTRAIEKMSPPSLKDFRVPQANFATVPDDFWAAQFHLRIAKGADRMSAQGTAAAKKSITKGQQMAREMAKQLGGVAVKAGSGGMTLMSKAEVKRRELIDAEKAKLAAREQPAAAPVLNSKGKKATKREIASRASVARGREKPTLTIVPAAP